MLGDATTSTSRVENNMEDIVTWGTINYACPNIQGSYAIAPPDTYTSADMRAPGAATGMAMFEIAMDELAYKAGIDPLAFRQLNYSDIDNMNRTPFTSKALREAYDEGAERFGWARRSPEPRSMREGRELIGWGMATGLWEAHFMKTSASARLGANGHLEVASASSDIGTGTYTVMTQVAADTLGLSPDNITRVAVAVAAGRIINPKTARSQILGGVVMAIGMALHEETVPDRALGKWINHSFGEYHVPAHADIEDIDVIFVEETDPEVTPLGVKGVGEIGVVGVAAAVANAIYHATGKRVRSLPITVDKLLAA